MLFVKEKNSQTGTFGGELDSLFCRRLKLLSEKGQGACSRYRNISEPACKAVRAIENDYPVLGGFAGRWSIEDTFKNTKQSLGSEEPQTWKGQGPERADYEYERNGTAANFMFTEPLASWRKVNVRHCKTSLDWAYEVKELLDKDYPEARKVIFVCDNLNTHKIASFYEVFEPKQALRLVHRLEIHYTPKHGSWLNVAEIELSVFTKQCLDRRIPDMATLQQEAKAWYRRRNANQKTVDWQFTTDDARVKLKRLYPQIQML